LAGLVGNAQNKTEYEYDVVSGISGGALNAVLLSQFEKG
jgi:hypothetical protein